MQRTIGNRRALALFGLASAHDEERADRAADAISQHRRPDTADLEGVTLRGTAALLPSMAARIRGLSGGSLAPEGIRRDFAAYSNVDLAQVRIHADGAAASLASTLGARAFTVGTDIVFGAGEYAPETAPGRQLLAHELAHVAQQRAGATPVIQMASIRAYNDSSPLHDPSRLTDVEIEATDEYRALMAMPRPIPMAPILAEEARLACRLLLRAMREGRHTVSGRYAYRADVLDAELLSWLDTARARLHTTSTAEGSVGTQHWVAASATDVTAPTTADSEFTRWLLGGGTQPSATTGRLNCWEMVLFSAHRAGHLGETRMRQIYTSSVAAMSGGDAMAFPRTLERLLRSSNEHIYTPGDPNSPYPLRGDLIIFQEAANHVALATGRRINGQIEIVSHWPPPDGSYNVKITTIEALLARMRGGTVVKFWSPIW